MTTFVATPSGGRAALHDLGGAGPALLLVHATGFCARAYEPFAAHLAPHRRVWGLDLRGHGDSPPPADGEFAWEAMAQDVLAVVDHLGLGAVDAFGHSVGGAVLLLAELARPGVLARAFLYEPIVWPAGFEFPGGLSPMAQVAAKRREVFASRAEALERYASRPPLGLVQAQCLHAYVTHGFADLDDGTVRLKCLAESEAATFQAETVVTVDRLEPTAAAVTVAVGGRVAVRVGGLPAGPAALGEGVVAALGPSARLVRFAHLGHFGPLEDPATVADAALAALAP